MLTKLQCFRERDGAVDIFVAITNDASLIVVCQASHGTVLFFSHCCASRNFGQCHFQQLCNEALLWNNYLIVKFPVETRWQMNDWQWIKGWIQPAEKVITARSLTDAAQSRGLRQVWNIWVCWHLLYLSGFSLAGWKWKPQIMSTRRGCREEEHRWEGFSSSVQKHGHAGLRRLKMRRQAEGDTNTEVVISHIAVAAEWASGRCGRATLARCSDGNTEAASARLLHMFSGLQWQTCTKLSFL